MRTIDLLCLLAIDSSWQNANTTLFDSTGNNHYGTVIAIEREDGTGKSFNVTMRKAFTLGKLEKFHMRTID